MKSFVLSPLIVIVILFFGCKKSAVDQLPVITNAPATLATPGHVILFGSNNQPMADASGLTITVENSSPQITLPIKPNGDFDMASLGNQKPVVLAFSHTGYATVNRSYTATMLDSLTKKLAPVPDVALYPISSVVVNSLAGTVNGNTFKLTFNAAVNEADAGNGVIFFVKKNNSQVTYNDFDGDTNAVRTITIPVLNGSNTHSICINCSKECGFIKTGDTLYIKAWGFNMNSYPSNYFNPLTKNLVLPGINTVTNSPTIKLLVP